MADRKVAVAGVPSVGKPSYGALRQNAVPAEPTAIREAELKRTVEDLGVSFIGFDAVRGEPREDFAAFTVPVCAWKPYRMARP